MIPNLRFYATVAAIIALLGVCAYGARVIHKANRLDAVELQLAGERKAHRAAIAQVEENLAASNLQRQKLQQGLTEIADRFNKPLPPPKTLVHYVQVPGETCPRPSLSDAFIVRYNAAAD